MSSAAFNSGSRQASASAAVAECGPSRERIGATSHSATRPVAVLSHERSGTHLTIDLLRNNFRETHLKQRPFQNVKALYADIEEHLREAPEGLNAAVGMLGRRPILKSHILPDYSNAIDESFRPVYESLLADSDKLYVVRDGRDVMVSFHRFCMKFKGETRPFSEFLAAPIRHESLTPAAYWAMHVERWRPRQDVLLLRYEELVNFSPESITLISNHTGLSQRGGAPKRVTMTQSRLARAFRRMLGVQSSSAVLPGKGATGNWRSTFSRADHDQFMKDAGETLASLGYEEEGQLSKACVAHTHGSEGVR